MSGVFRCGGSRWESSWRLLSPPSRRGWLRPINKMPRYLEQGAAGVSLTGRVVSSDAPGRADFKVARHLLDRIDAHLRHSFKLLALPRVESIFGIGSTQR
jgi:hypothetical protein